MPTKTTLRMAGVLLLLLGLAYAARSARSQDSTVMGEVRFDGDTQLDRDSGVWVDGQYLGYVKELKGKKKVMLLPGHHQISVRQAGYVNFDRDIVVEPGETMSIDVHMKLIPGAVTPDVTSELKVTARPKRAAVFLDGKYVGHASELGGKFHSLLVSPGKHMIKIELAGYRTYETDVTVLAGQKSEIKTELVRGSIVQAGGDIKQPN